MIENLPLIIYSVLIFFSFGLLIGVKERKGYLLPITMILLSIAILVLQSSQEMPCVEKPWEPGYIKFLKPLPLFSIALALILIGIRLSKSKN